MGRGFCLLGLSLVVGVAAPAQAYVLPAEFLCRLIADGRKPSLRDATLTFRITREVEAALPPSAGALADQGTPSATPLPSPGTQPAEATTTPPLEARWYFKRPDLMRIEARTGPTEELVEIVRGGNRFVGDREEQRPAGPANNFLPLLLFPGGKDLDETSALVCSGLAAAGLDTNTTTLARFEQGFAYVIGGGALDTRRPQLWLDKASFAPTRLLFGPQARGSGAADLAPPQAAPSLLPLLTSAPGDELRLSNFVAGLPRAWEAWQGDKRLLRAEVVHLLANQRLDDDLFVPRTRGRDAALPPGPR